MTEVNPAPQEVTQPTATPASDDFAKRNAHAFADDSAAETTEAKPAEAPAPVQDATAEAEQKEKAAPEDDGEFKGVYAKYGKDPDKLAKAYLEARRLASQHELELARERGRRETSEAIRQQIIAETTEAKPKEEKPNGKQRFFADDEATRLLEQLADGEKSVEALNNLAETLEERIERRAQEKVEAQRYEQAVEENKTIIRDRAREILQERAEAEGDNARAKQYENPKRRITDEEFMSVVHLLDDEISFINENLQVGKYGKLDKKHFDYLKRLRDPEEYDKRLLQKGRIAALEEVQQSGSGEKTLMPGSTGAKATAFKPTVDLNAIAQQGDLAFQQYLDSLSPAEFDALKKRAGLE